MPTGASGSDDRDVKIALGVGITAILLAIGVGALVFWRFKRRIDSIPDMNVVNVWTKPELSGEGVRAELPADHGVRELEAQPT